MYDNNFLEFLISLKEHLNLKGFSINESDILDLINLISKLNVDITNKEEVMKYSKLMFTKTEDEFKEYDGVFIPFINKDYDTIFGKEILGNIKADQINIENAENEKYAIEDRLQVVKRVSENNYRIVDIDLDESYVKNKNLLDLFNRFKEEGEDLDRIDEIIIMIRREIVLSINDTNFNQIVEYYNKILDKLLPVRNKLAYESTTNSVNKIENKIKLMSRKVDRRIETVIKECSVNNREEFIGGTRAVQTLKDSEIFENNVKFNQMNKKDKIKITEALKEESIRFRTVANRSVKTNRKARLDFKNTIKKSTETNGIPMRLIYEKPKISKANIVAFLDISGSCSDVSDMMIHFLFYMKEVFKAGIKVYAFVNKLYDISSILVNSSPEKAIIEMNNSIPRKGVYSDYYTPFKTYSSENLGEINKDSIVIFIGDARNNNNKVGEDNIKKITEKSRKSIWINTEESELWNTGDSVIRKYSDYIDAMCQVTTPKELIQSIYSIIA